ncbi:MAG: type II toxin-antitoxin system Phd/YefM family antitoxin [Desulfuromonadales bacterium]|nr:type II toxin-antitoxin system Phd/YefM family antitoxin [Desulfuromonadales bacterium]
MKPLSIAEGVIPIGEFKVHAARYLKNLNGPMVITQNGRPAGVLLSPADYDRLTQHQLFMESVAAGLDDAENGKLLDADQLQVKLQLAREARTGR